MAKYAVFNAILAEYWLYRPSGNKYGQKSGTAGDKKRGVAFWRSLSFSFLALLTQTESLNDSTVALDILTLQVVEQTTTLTYKLHQRAVGAIVLVVSLHVLGQMADSVREKGNLAFARTGVSCARTILCENLLLFFFV